MGKPFGALLALAVPAGVLYLAHRVAVNIEGWFIESGAGDVIGWAFVACLVLTFLALPVGAFGLAARCWVVRLDEHERLESTARVLVGTSQRQLGDRPSYEIAHPDDLQLDRMRSGSV